MVLFKKKKKELEFDKKNLKEVKCHFCKKKILFIEKPEFVDKMFLYCPICRGNFYYKERKESND